MPTASKHGLGRGLGALIPPKAVGRETGPAGVQHVDIRHIEPNPQQPRKRIIPETIDELAASIREHGLLQPLLLTEINTAQGPRYQLIAGERRWRAAQRAGLSQVPAIVKGVTPQQMLELALVENVQRADLNALEEAEAYRQLIQDFNLTQEQVAHKVGKDRTTVSNALRLLKMPDALKQALLDDQISEGHARALMQVTEPARQKSLLKQVSEHNLSVRQTEELVRRTLAQSDQATVQIGANVNRPPSTVVRPPASHSIEEDLRRALGTKVELYHSQRGGKIIIEFYSDEELDAIYEKIVG